MVLPSKRGDQLRQRSQSLDVATRRRTAVSGRSACIFLMCSALLWGSGLPSAIAGDEVPEGVRAAILLRAIAYEKSFSAGKGEALLVVVGPDGGSGAADAQKMSQAFQQIAAKVKVGQRSVKVVQLRHGGDTEATRQALGRMKPDVVYVATGLRALLKQLDAAPVPRRTVVCGSSGDLGKGCVIGVELVGNRSQLVVDMVRMSAASLQFDSRLLRLARRI